VSYLHRQDCAASQLKKLGPEERHARTLVAEAFVEEGRTTDAIHIYEKLRWQDRPPCLRSELGFAYAQASLLDKAKEAFQEDLGRRSGCLLANLGLARVALVGGDTAEMLHQLHEVEERTPQFLRAYLQRVWSGLEADQVKNLITELQKPAWAQDPMAARVVESVNSGISPSLADAHSAGQNPANPGMANRSPEELWTEDRYSACAEKIQKVKPPRPAALTTLLEQCSFYAGDYPLTLETTQHALQTASRDVEALYWQAKSAQELSANSFARMNAVAPDSPKVHLLMAELHRTREEFAAAAEEYNEVLKSGSSRGEEISARLGLADVDFHNLEYDKALAELQSVLKSDPSNADANSLLGQVLVRRHQYDDAIPHLKLALQGNSPPSLPDVHSLLAKCYYARGEYSEALEELKPALSADTMGAFYFQLYQVYLKLGDQKSAAAALRKSEQLRQNKSEAEQQHLLSEDH
jgi:tetratricopeptide (TPR) repeat protein